MQCVKASIPVPAVRVGGSPRVSSGSQMATLGSKGGAEDDRLTTVLGKLDQCPPGRLGPRARRGGYRHHRRECGGDPRRPTGAQVVIDQWSGMRHQESNRLGRIDRAAAAQSDQPVAPLGSIALEPGQDVFLGRVGMHVAKQDSPIEPTAGDDLRDQTRRFEARVGDDQGALDSKLGELLGQECPRPRTKADAVGEGEDRRHRSSVGLGVTRRWG